VSSSIRKWDSCSLGIRRRLRVYLEEKYAVGTTYLFLGYLPEQQNLYRSLQRYGYVLVFSLWKTPLLQMRTCLFR